MSFEKVLNNKGQFTDRSRNQEALPNIHDHCMCPFQLNERKQSKDIYDAVCGIIRLFNSSCTQRYAIHLITASIIVIKVVNSVMLKWFGNVGHPMIKSRKNKESSPCVH